MRVAFVFLSALSVASAFVSNVGRSATAGYYRTSQLRMTAEEREIKDVKVGVIGCGRIGLVHLEAITKAPGVTPVIVSNPTVSKAEKAAQQYNVKKFTSDAMDVITDPEVDAVWICSPSQYHADQIKACAANGKDVFCEKPIATDLAETVEAINACNEAGVKLMIGLQRRFDSNFMRVRESVVKGEVGDPIIIKLCSRDPAPPPYEYVKGGGGIFADMAVHDLDMTRFLAGKDPIDILAVGSTHIDMSIENLPGSEKYDTASCIVRYPGGVQAMVDVCRQSSYGYDQRAEVLGTMGMIQTDNVYPNTAKIYKSHFTGNADMPYDFFLSRYNEAYVTETIAFCESLVNDTPVPCTGEDGLVALVMALAADKSAEEGRWVSFREIIEQVFCVSPTECSLLAQSEAFPEGFKPVNAAGDLLLPDVDSVKKGGLGAMAKKLLSFAG
eukprot:CAMPEP_0202494366 /NCGR_PEP_ID=MMETSP1361-20130828/11208_1 /ASSEMBLY_ACC=CAM_ASM_000849 /TAXON_ID=210615 /ORGANISM="Staurosira complex sp., Strain CCMP2646" /LENGTH=441 /DNA_ID=CAMNT_0049124823 /DNA_START=68 /DNA_END=1393 /DNA_ORIENTATION=-